MSGDLFIPLKTAYYDAFEAGTKREEYRLHSNRWNVKTCRIGRPVTLSKGYGKSHRLKGTITSSRVQPAAEFSAADRTAILDCYGTLDVVIACIGIEIEGRA